ncbi:hypothetical protein [Allorhodopirellula solitaria]|uniref:Uncharacterized protein n=1 Tax=Allorhodopirellula solitaria TaxID=2527987 RepID=A0A5C5YBB5_9BACT|nr:hypothetical protein [Allorhodopirellula solitaria]TWT72987.1 hypothetical protein CA85_14480 [Allorhodopirellula solitaria]
MNVSLCRDDATYSAGGYLRASWRVSRVKLEELSSVEVSVLWYTEGKGDEDLSVHYFRRYDAANLRNLGIGDSQPIHCRLPPSPLSYRGHLLKIQWGIRVRVFVEEGREAVAEHPFYVVARKPEALEMSEMIQSELARVDAPAKSPLHRRLPAVMRRWRSRPAGSARS